MAALPNNGAAVVGITGSRGFIGRAVVRALEAAEIRVRELDGDIRDPATFTADMDVLVHLAALTPGDAEIDAAEMVSVNVAGTAQALEACRERGAAIVFASTSGIYRPLTARRALREDAPVEPRWLYPLTKCMGERLCMHYAREHGLRGSILRLFNVYGPGQSDFFLVPYLIGCALDGRIAEVRNKRSIRDFIHIDDVARAFKQAVHRDGDMSAFNVGTGVSTDMAMLVKAIGTAIDVDEPVFDLQDRQTDPTPIVFADIAVTCKALDWAPFVTLEDGLATCIAATSGVNRQK